MDLSERKKKILRAVIEQYIQTAEPVGSKAIVQHSGLKVSSATIRNDMAELEELQLLEQPHTSAGRIPSPLGYRFYVNELMEEHRLTLQETQSINEALHLKIKEMDQVMTEAGKIVSQITRYPTFALTTGSGQTTISRFELLIVDRNAFIVVILTNSQVVKNKLIRLPKEISDTQMQLLNTLLNASFTGKTIEEINLELIRTSSHANGEAYELIRTVVVYAIEILQELEGKTVHTTGITNLLAHPEYQSLDSAGPLMNFLSGWEDSLEISPPKDQPVQILIGPENVTQELKNSSIIMACYDIGENMQGVIGVVGPTRMDYAKLAARLSYFAEGLSRLFGKAELSEPDNEET